MRMDFTGKGAIALNGVEVPGIFQRVTVEGELVVDTKKRAGRRSGFSKRPKGFSDAVVKVEVLLMADDNGADPYAQYASLSQRSYKTDKFQRPIVYRVLQAAINAHGITRVLFQKLKIVDDNETKEGVRVLITLSQYRPMPKVRRRRRKLPSLAGIEASDAKANAAFAAKMSELDRLGENPGLAPLILPDDGSLPGLLDYDDPPSPQNSTPSKVPFEDNPYVDPGYYQPNLEILGARDPFRDTDDPDSELAA